jgi:hypothetical protein
MDFFVPTRASNLGPTDPRARVELRRFEKAKHPYLLPAHRDRESARQNLGIKEPTKSSGVTVTEDYQAGTGINAELFRFGRGFNRGCEE